MNNYMLFVNKVIIFVVWLFFLLFLSFMVDVEYIVCLYKSVVFILEFCYKIWIFEVVWVVIYVVKFLLKMLSGFVLLLFGIY